MPNFCNAGQSARVFFQYPGENQDNISVLKSPVNVELTQVQGLFTGGQCNCSRYEVRVGARDQYGNIYTGRLFCFGPIGAAYVVQENGAWHARFRSGNCSNGALIGYEINTAITIGSPIEIASQRVTLTAGSDDCGSLGGGCTFTVKDGDGIVRFQKSDSVCPEYVVSCGSNCPPGTVECCGCCLPCAETKQELRALVNQVRGL